jgi:urease accessory protein
VRRLARRPLAVRAAATASVSGGVGAVWLSDVRSQPPLTLRRSGGRLLVVGSAAGPVGGDELQLDLCVKAGAAVSIGTAAATMVWPGPNGARSTMCVTIDVGADAHVDWHPCPTVSVAGSDHRMTTVVRLGPAATCRVVEELGLGRGDEHSGALDASVRIERRGATIVHHREQFGPGVPGWGGTTAVGRARFVYQEFSVGAHARHTEAIVDDTGAAAVLPMAADVTAVLAAGRDRPSVQALLDRVRWSCSPIGSRAWR